jgi:peptidoglycan/LPS O-acetylase OafA/YrhL
MVSRRDTRFQEIDVLRGLAALTVVFSHYIPYWNRYLTDIPVLLPNDIGYYAVKLFFIISGFVILITLERCSTIVDFALLRFSRLYPVYWASLVVTTLLAVLVFGGEFWLAGFVTNLTMFQEFLGYPHFDNVYWSLSVELAFYLNVGWLFALKLHRTVHWLVAAWLVLTIVWATTLGGSVLEPGELLDDRYRDWLALLFVLDYSPYFAIGILFYRAQRHGWAFATAALFGLAFAVEFLLNSWRGLAVALVNALLFGLAVNGYLRFLVCRATLWLGTISYSLYLVHRNLGYHLLDWMHAHAVNAAAAILVVAGCALLLATALTYGVERPGSARLRFWYGRWRRSLDSGRARSVVRGKQPKCSARRRS